jgi:lipoate-protein ligase A
LSTADPAAPAAWASIDRRGSVADLHGLDLDLGRRALVWMTPTAPALALGSAQRADSVDALAAAAQGVAVTRRRSGGGGVLVVPGEMVWLDVVVPRGDRWWDDDVGRSMVWLGEVWGAALADVGVASVVHPGAFERSPWSATVCFAGVGSGEVLTPDRRKLVGISQRRTRRGARLQSMCHLVFRAEEMAGLMVDGPSAEALAALVATAAVPAEALRARLEHHLQQR